MQNETIIKQRCNKEFGNLLYKRSTRQLLINHFINMSRTDCLKI